MLSSVNMVRKLLTDAIATTSYLVKRSPFTMMKCSIQDEVCSCNIVDYAILKIFYCAWYVRVSNGKFNGRARKYIFLGYV